MQRGKLRERTGERAGRFEERLLRGEGSELARLCLEELRDNVWRDRVGSRWEEESPVSREKDKSTGMGGEKVGGKGIEELKRRGRERERKERWEGIRSSSKW